MRQLKLKEKYITDGEVWDFGGGGVLENFTPQEK